VKEKEGKNYGYKGKGAVKDHLYISKGISEPCNRMINKRQKSGKIDCGKGKGI